MNITTKKGRTHVTERQLRTISSIDAATGGVREEVQELIDRLNREQQPRLTQVRRLFEHGLCFFGGYRSVNEYLADVPKLKHAGGSALLVDTRISWEALELAVMPPLSRPHTQDEWVFWSEVRALHSVTPVCLGWKEWQVDVGQYYNFTADVPNHVPPGWHLLTPFEGLLLALQFGHRQNLHGMALRCLGGRSTRGGDLYLFMLPGHHPRLVHGGVNREGPVLIGRTLC